MVVGGKHGNSNTKPANLASNMFGGLYIFLTLSLQPRGLFCLWRIRGMKLGMRSRLLGCRGLLMRVRRMSSVWVGIKSMGFSFFSFLFLERSLDCLLGGYGILWMVKEGSGRLFSKHIQYIGR